MEQNIMNLSFDAVVTLFSGIIYNYGDFTFGHRRSMKSREASNMPLKEYEFASELFADGTVSIWDLSCDADSIKDAKSTNAISYDPIDRSIEYELCLTDIKRGLLLANKKYPDEVKNFFIGDATCDIDLLFECIVSC